jgi:hypothetical protein
MTPVTGKDATVGNRVEEGLDTGEEVGEVFKAGVDLVAIISPWVVVKI